MNLWLLEVIWISELSEFEEMYLKRIFEIYDSEPSTIVKTSQLAEIMSVSNASSTEMIQRLSDRGLLLSLIHI